VASAHGLLNAPLDGSPASHNTSFQQHIDLLDHGIFMLSGAGSKRSSPDDLESAANLIEARSAFNAAARAVMQEWGPDELKPTLKALGPHVNLSRMQQDSGYPALHAALAKHVMPYKYPRLVDAVKDICGGKHQRTAETHAAAVSRLIKRLGGQPAVTEALPQCIGSSSACSSQLTTSATVSMHSGGTSREGSAAAAACSLVMLSDQLLQQTPRVTAIMGITGRSDKPVALRLALPTFGLMPPDATPSPPLSPPAFDTLDLDALDLGDLMDDLDSDLGTALEGLSDSELMGWFDSLSEPNLVTGQRKRACVMSVSERASSGV
jgi:hypothetical protein